MIFKRILDLVKQIPVGKVTTYKTIRDQVGLKDTRIVGYALHANRNPIVVPCHRVVKSDGSIADGYVFGGKRTQIALLKKEGVKFKKDGKVDLSNFFFCAFRY